MKIEVEDLKKINMAPGDTLVRLLSGGSRSLAESAESQSVCGPRPSRPREDCSSRTTARGSRWRSGRARRRARGSSA